MKKKQPYIYILPNTITTLSLMLGFLSIIFSIENNFVMAAYAVIIATIFDLLDGRIARLTKSSSAFGAEYDSLADLISFGVAPSILLFQAYLHTFPRIGWIAGFFFVACSALRLARFGTQQKKEKVCHYFQGLPTPVSAGVVASFILAKNHLLESEPLPLVILISVFILGTTMVSNIQYYSFKHINLRTQKPFRHILFVILLIALIAHRPQMMFFVFFATYTILGILLGLFKKTSHWIHSHKETS